MTAWSGTAVPDEVYVRSFADGDGIGDLHGLLQRLPHIAALGVDGIWITPWYPSPMKDGGYDVADYRGIDPLFGDLGTARAVVDTAHRLGLKVVVDFVANHTSDEHAPWAGGEPPFAFSATGRSWLPQPAGWAALTAERQESDPGSTLAFYRAALTARRSIPAAALAWDDLGDDVLAFRRGDLRCILNLGDRPLPIGGTPVLASAPLEAGALPIDAACWIRG